MTARRPENLKATLERQALRPHSRTVKNFWSSRIPCLDGLRALSILLVLLGHLRATRGFPSLPWVQLFGDVANLGVRCFFVISGFLITHLLLKEARRSGKVSLKAFYIRRIFRIFPAFYTFLGVVAGLTLLGIFSMSSVDLMYAGSYAINFVHRKPWQLGHLWSLAVEEQFYLLWPVCIVALGWSKAQRVALSAIVLAPMLRIATWYLLPESRGIITKAFPTICDTIATGCILACLRDWLSGSRRYQAFIAAPGFVLVPLAVLLSNSLGSHTRPDLLIGQTIRNTGIALCIDWCLRNPFSRLGTFLNAGPMIWIGTLSYSLYLWQQLFLNRSSASLLCSFPVNIGLAFVLAMLSFYLVERPCLRARVRLFPDSGGARKAGAHGAIGVAAEQPPQDPLSPMPVP